MPTCVAAAHARKSSRSAATSADAPAACVMPDTRMVIASVAGGGGRYVADAVTVLLALAPAGRVVGLSSALAAGVPDALPLRVPVGVDESDAPSLIVALELLDGV